jgi:hypothetical protein
LFGRLRRFSVTVSARALKVASRISFNGFDQPMLVPRERKCLCVHTDGVMRPSASPNDGSSGLLLQADARELKLCRQRSAALARGKGALVEGRALTRQPPTKPPNGVIFWPNRLC